MKFGRSTAFLIILLTADALFMAGCGMNIYRTITPATTSDAKIAEARAKIDNRDYSGARDILKDLAGSDDSNTVRILWAASILGVGGLDMWKVFGDAITNLKSGSKTHGSGPEKILSLISDSVLGSDDVTRSKRISALRDAVGVLRTAPQPEETKLNNAECLLAGLLVVPTAADATRLLTETQAALETVRSSATGGGAICPAIDAFSTALTDLTLIQGAFSDVLDLASGCALLKGFLDQNASSLNVAQSALAKLVHGADKGCHVPSSPLLKVLFPTCVMDILQQEGNAGTANDGQVSSCEFITNCTGNSACF